MENTNISRSITASLIVLLAICVTWLLIIRHSNTSLNERLDMQRLELDALLSGKQLVQKTIDKSRDSLASLKREKARLDELFEHKAKVATTQTRENRRIKKALEFAKDQNEAQSTLNAKLSERLRSRDLSFHALDSLSKKLTDSLEFVQGENAYLKHQLNEAVMRSIDQTLISAVKRNNAKVTSKARATKKLIANVEVPAALNNLRFVLEGPNGKALSGANGAITARVVDDDKSLTASTNNDLYPETKSQNIEITYVPDERLEGGIYTFKIFNDGNYVGSMMVNLR